MKPETYVLVVISQSNVRNQIERIFATERQYRLHFANGAQEALQMAGRDLPEIDLVLIDDAIADASALETIRKLAILMPSVPIVAIADQEAVSYVREALLAGARAFVIKPLNDADVINTAKQLLHLESVRREQKGNGGAARKCQIITVMSPKGGVGATMLAVNVAVDLREKTGNQVALLDAQATLGDLDTALNLQSQFSCADLVGHGAQLDAELLSSVLTIHTSGVQVLTSSQELEDADYISPELMDRIVDLLAQQVDYLIIDAGTLFEDQTASVLAAASTVLLVATPEITALRRCAAFVKAAEENGFPRETIHLVVNREGVAGGLSTEDISQYLNMRVAATIPDDPGLVIYSMNRGIPLVTSSPRSAVARRISKLTDSLIPKTRSKQAEEGSILGRLSTILRSNPA